MSGHGGSQRLTEGEYGPRVFAFTVDQIRKRCIDVAVKPRLAWLSLASAVTAVFQCKNVRRSISKKLVDAGTVGYIAGVAVKSQECEFGVLVGNPPSVELHAIRRRQPNIVNRQTARMPIASEAVRV